jgi:hypothetical protein
MKALPVGRTERGKDFRRDICHSLKGMGDVKRCDPKRSGRRTVPEFQIKLVGSLRLCLEPLLQLERNELNMVIGNVRRPPSWKVSL